jgi:hypothetical protein
VAEGEEHQSLEVVAGENRFWRLEVQVVVVVVVQEGEGLHH